MRFKFVLPLLLLAATPVLAQSPAPKGSAKKGPAKKGPAIKHAEAILGKPLTDTQKKAIRAANVKRQKAIKPIQEKYRADAAKALGISLKTYEDREKKLRVKKAS